MAAPEQTQKTKSDELLEGQRKIERLLARARSLVATCGEPGDAHIAVARGLLDARSRDDEVTVAVVGLMKCGKSSLLNALCGTNLMPMDIPASTACVVRIVHEASAVVPSMVETTADGAILLAITGEAAIHNRLKELNAAGRANEHAGGTTVEIRVRLPALEHWRSDAPYRLVLLDTPGPNEAGARHLGLQVDRVLENADCILYLLDFTKMGTSDEKVLLDQLKSLNPALLQSISSRLFFVVNKIDVQAPGALQPPDTPKYVADYVKRQLDTVIDSSQVLLVSAAHARLSRLVRENRASQLDMRHFKQIVYGMRGMDKEYSAQELFTASVELETSCDIKLLEEIVLGYLAEHGGYVKLQAKASELPKRLQQLHNFLALYEAGLRKDEAEMKAEAAKLAEQLSTVKTEAQATMGTSQILTEPLEAKIRAMFEEKRLSLVNQLCRVVDGGKDQETSSGHRGVWETVRKKYPSLSSQQDKEELRDQLEELEAYVVQALEAELRTWAQTLVHTVESEHGRLVSNVDAEIEKFSRRVEEVVGKALNVTLQKADLNLPRTLRIDFDSNVDSFMGSGIRSATQQMQEVIQKTIDYYVWVSGPFNWGGRWEKQTAQREEVKVWEVKRFEPNADSVKAYFTECINHTLRRNEEAFDKAIGLAAAEYIGQAIQAVDGYTNRFLVATISATRAIEKGVEKRRELAQRVKDVLTSLAELEGEAGELEQETWALAPNAGGVAQ